jgi:hypothetical protein
VDYHHLYIGTVKCLPDDWVRYATNKPRRKQGANATNAPRHVSVGCCVQRNPALAIYQASAFGKGLRLEIAWGQLPLVNLPPMPSFRVKTAAVALVGFLFASFLFYMYRSMFHRTYDEALLARFADSKLSPEGLAELRPQDNAPLRELGKYVQTLLPEGVHARLACRGSLANVSFVAVAVHGCGFTIDDIFNGPEVRFLLTLMYQ